ncbi:insulinase family protein [archaeon]|jgi:predicted Zn-dependent peptidase|nr:insulinase family protein [archaeon]
MKENFKRKVLKNGLTIIFEKRDIPVVSMAIAVRAGGVNEELHEKGISHFIEHMLYKGTEKRNARKIAEDIEKNGGDMNGFTSEEITAFWCKMPSKNIELGLDVLGDIVKNSLFDEKELEKERQVIFEEIKMLKDNPRMHVFHEIQKFLYDGTMEISLAGNEETMNEITRDSMVKKFKEVYNPKNMVLCCVGDYDFDKLIKFAEDNFSGGGKEVKYKEFGLKNESHTEERKGIDQANLILAYHTPLAEDVKSAASQVLITLMAGGLSSRLFAEIREKRNLVYSIRGEANINKTHSYSVVYAATGKENVEKVKGLILDEYKKVSEELGEEELNQIKEQLIGNYHISMEDSQVQMVNLLAEEIVGDASKYYDFEKDISNVKLEDVKELAKKVAEGNYSFFALVPEGKCRSHRHIS